MEASDKHLSIPLDILPDVQCLSGASQTALRTCVVNTASEILGRAVLYSIRHGKVLLTEEDCQLGVLHYLRHKEWDCCKAIAEPLDEDADDGGEWVPTEGEQGADTSGQTGTDIPNGENVTSGENVDTEAFATNGEIAMTVESPGNAAVSMEVQLEPTPTAETGQTASATIPDPPRADISPVTLFQPPAEQISAEGTVRAQDVNIEEAISVDGSDDGIEDEGSDSDDYDSEYDYTDSDSEGEQDGAADKQDNGATGGSSEATPVPRSASAGQHSGESESEASDGAMEVQGDAAGSAELPAGTVEAAMQTDVADPIAADGMVDNLEAAAVTTAERIDVEELSNDAQDEASLPGWLETDELILLDTPLEWASLLGCPGINALLWDEVVAHEDWHTWFFRDLLEQVKPGVRGNPPLPAAQSASARARREMDGLRANFDPLLTIESVITVMPILSFVFWHAALAARGDARSVFARQLWGGRWAWVDLVRSFHCGEPLHWAAEPTGTTMVTISSDSAAEGAKDPGSAEDTGGRTNGNGGSLGLSCCTDGPASVVQGAERGGHRQLVVQAVLSELFLCNAIAEYLQ